MSPRCCAQPPTPQFDAHDRYEEHPPLEFETYDSAFMRAMISHARQFEPRVPTDVSEYIVEEYVRMRQESLHAGATFGFTSARTLLAILRLSQVGARSAARRVLTHPPQRA